MSAMISNNPGLDHSYELPLRGKLLLLLDLLCLLRFIAGVLLDRLGVASSCHGEVHLILPLPGQPWGGGEHASDVALERFLTEAGLLWETGSASLTAPRYRRRRRVVQPADDQLQLAAEDDDAEGEAVCAICLARLEESGDFEMVVAELCSCSHAFHAACIDAWVGSSDGDDSAATCPLCRAPMLPVGGCPRRSVWDGDGHSLSRPRGRPGD